MKIIQFHLFFPMVTFYVKYKTFFLKRGNLGNFYLAMNPCLCTKSILFVVKNERLQTLFKH